MKSYDEQYKELVLDVINNGYDNTGEEIRAKYADGTPAYAKSLIGRSFRFSDPMNNIPILTTKKMSTKFPLLELYWIWIMRSNIVQDLRDLGSNIWNEWEQEDGTIGKSYGYVLNQKVRTKEGELLNQVDNLIHELKTMPHSRRHVTELWIPKDLDEMSLMPCVHLTQWHVKGKKLILEVRARSSDLALGNPYNLYQYHILHRLIAQIVGLEVGEYIFHMGDIHVYDRHIGLLEQQVKREFLDKTDILISLNPDIDNINDFTVDDVKVSGLKTHPAVKYEIAE